MVIDKKILAKARENNKRRAAELAAKGLTAIDWGALSLKALNSHKPTPPETPAQSDPEPQQRASPEASPEIIVEIGAEGGSLTLYGVRLGDGTWRFCRTMNDQTPTYLDPDEGGSAIHRQTLWVRTWPEALALLDKYPWPKLHGMTVHSEFRALVWEAVKERMEKQEGRWTERRLMRWAEKCGITLEPPGPDHSST